MLTVKNLNFIIHNVFAIKGPVHMVYRVIVLINSSGTDYVLNRYRYQYDPSATPCDQMSQLSCKFVESKWNPYWVIVCVNEHLTLIMCLTHWGRVTHICVSELSILGSDNGLSPARRRAIIWTNAGILLIGPLGTNFSEILIEILVFSFKKMRLKVSSAKGWPFCLGLNVLTSIWH